MLSNVLRVPVLSVSRECLKVPGRRIGWDDLDLVFYASFGERRARRKALAGQITPDKRCDRSVKAGLPPACVRAVRRVVRPAEPDAWIAEQYSAVTTERSQWCGPSEERIALTLCGWLSVRGLRRQAQIVWFSAHTGQSWTAVIADEGVTLNEPVRWWRALAMVWAHREASVL